MMTESANAIGNLIESRYRVVEEIGAGGMGQLYRVADTGRENAELALKMVRLQVRGTTETDLLAKFQQEFRLLTQLWHPNLIEVQDYGVTEGGSFYYTMTYVEGPNLSEAMVAMGVVGLVPTMVQICRALAYLHARGVIHGDLKPANVLLDGEQARLVDFGLAQDMQVQQGGQRFITPYYAAPEIIQGQMMDGRVDLYSLGAIAYTWLVGQAPDFMLGSERLIAMMLKETLSGQSAVPPDIGDVVRRLLSENPEQRYATANEVIEALNIATGSAYELETRETASSYALRARFIGRQAEIEALRDYWGYSKASQGQMVLIDGESGVGKTRLVEELEVQVELEGARVIWGQCLESGGIAYQPWREVLRVLLRYIEGAGELDLARLGPVLAILLPELWKRSYMAGLAPPTELEPAAAQQRLNDAILRALQAAARTRPMLVVIEDAHWADEATQLLIGFLARVLDFGGLMVCITYRSEEVTADQFLDQISGEPVKRISLQNLMPECTNELVESMLGIAHLPQGMMEKIQGTTGGNTFFAQELIRSLAEEGVVLQRTLDGWRVDEVAFAEVGLPESIQQVIWRRLERFSTDTQMVLRWAAVVGVAFWDGAIAYAGEVEKSLVARALSEAAEQELVILRDESSFRGEREYLFAKPVMQQVSYIGIHQEERLGAHARLVSWLLARPDEEIEGHLGQIAEHLEGAGQIEQAVEYFRRAGEQAAAQFANAEALDYFNRALQLAPEDQLTMRYSLLIHRERVYHLQGARRAQLTDLNALDELANALADDRKRAEVSLRRSNYTEVTGDYAAAIAAAQQAITLSQAAQDRQIEAEGYMQWGSVLWRQGDYKAAQLQLEKALTLAQTEGNRYLETDSLRSLGVIAALQSDYATGMTISDQALQIDREIGNRQGEATALGNLGLASSRLGDYARAKAFQEQALQIHREIGYRMGQGLVLDNLGILFSRQGDYATARDYYDQARGIYRDIGERGRESEELCNLALLLHHMGDDKTAQAYSQEALKIAQEIGSRRWQGFALTNLGHALTGQGYFAEAADAYRQAQDIRNEWGEEHLAIESLAGLARVFMAQEDLGQAHSTIVEILSFLETDSLDGTDDPFRIYLTCYYVLHAYRDTRAGEILNTAYHQLQERAAKISDQEIRRSFLENVATHREIILAYDQYMLKDT